MELSIGDRWEAVVEAAVRSGRYESPEAVVLEGLRLVEEQEARRHALRSELEHSLADPRPSLTDAAVGKMLRRRAASPRSSGDNA